MPDEKNKRTVQILTILYSSRFVRPQRFTLGEQSEKRKNNDNEQWNLALANKIVENCNERLKQ